MEHSRKGRRCAGLLLGLAIGAAMLLAAPRAFAGPNSGSVQFSFGMDFTTAYFFRGILQERDGFIWQPYGEINVPLYVDEGAGLSKFTLFVGNWNSIQSEKTLSRGGGSGPGNWYESDVYAGLKFSLFDTVELKPYYYVYTYPNGAFPTIQEIDFAASLNDAQWLDKFALNPSALMAWEFDNTTLGTKEGTYAEVNIRPSFTVYDDETYPVSLAIPMTVGMSVSDYYESPSGRDQSFGYYKAGLIASVPLGFIPEEYGAWAISAGPSIYAFNSNLKNYNKGNNPWVVGTVSLTFSY
jgi:hypothetical protein